MSDELAIQARGLSKRYRIKRRAGSRGTGLLDRFPGVFRSADPELDYFWALRDVSFDIRHGESVGFVGMNGSGKSTTLKVLSRITAPTQGTVRINGRLGALLEVGTGFHGELTGRENIFLYGSILGMQADEIRAKFDRIVDFSEIGQFLDTPVKRYSSGMYVRLAFAVAAHLDPDILVLDEVLAVGDVPFQRKCIDFAKGLRSRDVTILFVSHNMATIRNMCTRVIYLRRGQVVYDGPTEDGLAIYEADCRKSLHHEHADSAGGEIRITDVRFCGADGATKGVFEFGEKLVCKITYSATRPVRRPNFLLTISRVDETYCCTYSSETDGVSFDEVEGTGVVTLTTPPLKLTAESYSTLVTIQAPASDDVLSQRSGGGFQVRHPVFDHYYGVFHESADWDLGPG